MKFDERDFETLLHSDVSDLPPEDIVSVVTPWKKSMHQVLLGLALSSLTLNFWCLNYILPTIGMILMLLGFRVMRRENVWLRSCYVITVIRCLYFFPTIVLNATIYQQAFYESGWAIWCTIINLILQFALFVCLWQGIKAVQRKSGLEEHAGGAVGLIVWFLLVIPYAFVINIGIIGVGIVLVIYILAIRSLWKLAGEMDEAGYMIEPAPVRVSDIVVTGIIVLILAVGLVCAYLFGGTYRMDWQEQQITQDAEIVQTKEHLINLGFPKEILDDLTDEDILACKGATRVAVDVTEFPFNKGRTVTEYRESPIFTLQEPGYYITTQYDVKELVITGIGVELPTEREQWKIIHHFCWVSNPGYFGTESIQLWPAYQSKTNGWGKASECSGRILYDNDGTTYTAPYVRLDEETYTQNSFFFGDSVTTDIFAEFSLPREGENHRGYVSYTIQEMIDGYIVNAWINYTHHQTWVQYPVLTAKGQRIANSWNEAGAFKTVQDALQFYPTEDELEVIGADDN